MAQTKVKLISDGVIVQSNLHASHGITTAHVGEGSNLYYTDARVGSYLSTNSVGIGTPSPQQPLHVQSAGDLFTRYQANSSANGVQFQTWHGNSQTMTINSNTTNPFTVYVGSAGGTIAINVDSNADVGIGTATPGEKLDVDGNIRVRGVSATKQGVIHNSGSYFSLVSTGDTSDTTGARIWLGNNSSANAYYQNASSHYFRDLSSSIKMTLDSSGNIGIGTTSPGSTLELYGNTSSGGYGVYPALTLRNDNASGFSVIHFNQSTAQKARVEVSNSLGSMGLYTGSAANGITILSSGNIGIGQTGPGQKLVIGNYGSAADGTMRLTALGGQPTAGTIRNSLEFALSSEFSVNSGDAYKFSVGLNSAVGNQGSYNSDFVIRRTTRLGVTDNVDFLIDGTSGNIGIGSLIPNQKLSIGTNAITSNPEYIEFQDFGAGSNWAIGMDFGGLQWHTGDGTGIGAHLIAQIKVQNERNGAAAAGALVFSTAPYNTVMSERMRIKSNGVVYIGYVDATAIGGHKLEVNGALYASGNIRTNGIFSNNSAPDDDVFEAIQSGRKNSLKTYFSSGSTESRWVLKTSTGATDGSTVDALTVKPTYAIFNGGVGIGATSTPYKLRLKTDATHTNGVYISAGTGNGNHSLYVEDQGSTAEYFAIRGDGEIRLNASSGHTYAAQGIRFGANATANNLDDYEEGTWTPGIRGSSTAGTATISGRGGTYTKIGNKVTCWFSILNFSQSGAAGNFEITGLPFTCITTNSVRGCFSSNVRFYRMPFPGDVPVISLSHNTTFFTILWSRNNTTWIAQSVSNTGNQYIEGYVTYTTA